MPAPRIVEKTAEESDSRMRMWMHPLSASAVEGLGIDEEVCAAVLERERNWLVCRLLLSVLPPRPHRQSSMRLPSRPSMLPGPRADFCAGVEVGSLAMNGQREPECPPKPCLRQ